ncbi:MAG: leucine-rich repeat domain-containing protein, partial [Clostridium sp.]
LNNAETAVEKAKALIKSLNNKAAGKSALEKRVNDVEKIIKNARIQFNENMNFEFSKGKITKYIGNKTDIIIPEKINGEKVTAIGKKAFTEKGLISVKIPDTVKNIGDGAFEKCASLKAIIIPNSIKSIGNDAFSGCTNLTSATIPEGLESIGEYAFYECSGLESVTIPSSVNRIGNHSFCYCDSITSLTISEGVKEIGFSAFLHCKSLPSVTIPKSVDVLDEWAFSGCDNLAAINVDKDNKNYSDIDGILFNKDKTIFIQYLDKHGDKYEVPEGVTKLAKGAFCDTKITSVILPESLKIIGFSALQECPNLTSIEIPKNVTTIDHSAFSDSENLKSIFIPENVKTIKNYVFNGCTNLESVTIDNYKEAVNIGRRAIADSVKIIYLKEHLEENWGVEDFTFEGTSITGFSEKGNEKLKTNTDIVIPSTIGGKEVTAIGKKAFTEKGLISVKIPDTVKNIGEGAFEECKSLKSITIPEKVASIGNNAFENCTSLKSITIDNYQGAVTIGDNAFDKSINLNYLKKQPEGKMGPVVNESVSATSITKGSKLADSNLSGAFKVSYNDDTEVEGDLKWKNPDTIVNEAGEFSWIFIPHDNKKYTEVEGVIKFKDGDNGKIEVDCG